MSDGTSIYGLLRPLEVKGNDPNLWRDIASINQMGVDRRRQAKEDAHTAKEREYQGQQRELQAKKQRTLAFGSAAESLAGMSPEQRAASWPQARAGLLETGMFTPDGLPEQFDEGMFRSAYSNYTRSPEYLEKQKTMAEIAKLKAEALRARRRDPGTARGEALSPGEKKADEEFGKDASEYYYGGGRATVEKNFQRLGDAIGKMEGNKNLTGGFTTALPWLGDDKAQDFINPDLAAVRDEVRGAVQGSLKQILGGQYTEREGEAIFSRAFNPRLSTEENIRRASTELEALKRMAGNKDAAMAYFKAKGTLQGFEPGKTNLRDREAQYAGGGAPGGATGGWGMKEANAGERPDFNSMSDDELKAYVGGR
jgi:hypothetical protein